MNLEHLIETEITRTKIKTMTKTTLNQLFSASRLSQLV
jgi:hypothetical protein